MDDQEDFNQPSDTRKEPPHRLQALLLADVSPHFWAACHLCDMQRLALLVQTAELNRDVVLVAAADTYSMVESCKQAIPFDLLSDAS